MTLHLSLRRLLARIATGIGMLFASASLAFVALHMMPGDPVTVILGGATANPTPEAVAAVTRDYALDKPLPVQFLLYLSHLARGDLGVSFTQHLSVASVLREQMGPTLELAAASLLFAWVFALASVLCTTRRGRVLSGIGAGMEVSAAALPQFWLGLLLLWGFAFELRLLPPAGSATLSSLVLPTLSLAIPLGGFLAQVTRESLEIALDQPFMLSARMRGLSAAAAMRRHALRHALLPGIGLSAWALGALLGSAAIVESIFSRKGLGREMVGAVSSQDMPLTIGILLFVTLSYVVGSVVIEMIYELVDPRLAASRRAETGR